VKIGFVTTMNALPWAGSEELWYGAARQLRALGHDVEVYFPALRGWAPQQYTDLQAQGVRVQGYGWRSPRTNHLMGQIGRRWKRLPVSYPFPRNGHWQALDHVLVSQGACYDGLPWLDMLYRAGVPYTILCQANMESNWPDDETAELALDRYTAARRVCFVSEENRRLFCVQTGYEGDNTAVVWNPLQPSTPERPLPWPTPEDGDDRLKIAIVGRIEPFAKGQDLLIEVMSQPLWRQRPIVATLFGRGPWKRTAERLITQRGLNNVVLGGFASPEQIWREHHLLALPSRHEGMSLAMLEAMWLGRPVLATAVAGALSEVEDGINGFLCAAPSVASWEAGMERAWQSRDRWADMGRAAASRLRARMPADPAKSLADLLMNGQAPADVIPVAPISHDRRRPHIGAHDQSLV